tara:strand:- start:1747 stop:1914 length:168 start_codon:yes stop_codon:yes gene_type:complete
VQLGLHAHCGQTVLEAANTATQPDDAVIQHGNQKVVIGFDGGIVERHQLQAIQLT